MTVKDAVKVLINTYQSLEVAARGLVVDGKEVAEAMAKADPESAEYVALSVLAKQNPHTPEKPAKAG